MLSARAVPFVPKPHPVIDRLFLAICSLIAAAILVMLGGRAVFASLASFWPYDLTPSLKNYDFDMMDGGGWASYRNSLDAWRALTAVLGTAIIFSGAYLLEKTRGFGIAAQRRPVSGAAAAGRAGAGARAWATSSSSTAQPIRCNFIYGTMAILVLCTVAHFYSVAHLTAVTALKQIDPEFETVSVELRVPFYATFAASRCRSACRRVLDIAMYLFVNAMTTVSAVVFLYSPQRRWPRSPCSTWTMPATSRRPRRWR